MKNQQNNQSGFTLIELIVVIVILGILAATALPKFSNLQGDARVAKMNGAIGALSSAGALARGTQLAQGLAPGSAISMDGVTITMVSGYPDVSASGIVLAANLEVIDFPRTASGTTAIIIQPDAAHTGTTCTVTYTVSTGNNAAPVITRNNLNTVSCL